MHYFICGPSGVGKTTFGDWIGNGEYLHIPIDRGDDGNGLVIEGFTDQFNQLLAWNPIPMVETLDKRARAAAKSGCVLTFWSGYCWSPTQVTVLARCGIAVRYLYGPKEKCIEAFIQRELVGGHPKRDRAFWCANNPYYERMGDPDLAPYRVEVIDPSGVHLSSDEIARQLGMVHHRP